MNNDPTADKLAKTKFVGKWRTINKDGKEEHITISKCGRITLSDG